MVHEGEVHLTDCRFTGAVRDEVKQTGGIGLLLRGGTRGVIQNCECTGNGLHGIEVTGQARPELVANRCENNIWSGIVYFETAAGTARNNFCTGNGRYGIAVFYRANPHVERKLSPREQSSKLP